jgi:hypothetical protein
MITNFKIFEKTKTFNIKGQSINFELSNNKIYDVDIIKNLDLSYQELIDCGLWQHITISQRRLVIGDTYSFFYGNFGDINHNKVKECIGQEVLCFNDKAGPFGGKPSITEGKLYDIYNYNDKTKKIKIKNDDGKFAQVSVDRFCKTSINLDIFKYNL